MEYKVFYRKYRPTNFSELIGQKYIKEILINSIKNNKIAHAYIFTGPRGTGKTSTAKIFAKTINCLNNQSGISCEKCDICLNFKDSADIIEIDAASNNGVEEIRTLRDNVKILPYNSKYKVYIIDEVHMLSNSAWNALLKTLEEPPAHVVFILATTEISKIPKTVISRCQRFDFSKISHDDMKDALINICKLENLKIENKALDKLITLSNGCLRDALSLLDQLSKIDNNITLNKIEEIFGIISDSKLNLILLAIVNNDKTKIFEIVDEINNSGVTPLNFIDSFIEFLLNKTLDSEDENEIIFFRKIIMQLSYLLMNFNPLTNLFILIKLELISIDYFPGNKVENISQLSSESIHDKNDTKEKKVMEVTEEKDLTRNDYDKAKNIRINNGFVGASKKLKNQFVINWKNFINKLSIDNNYNVLGFIENAKIEVVSITNIIFSFDSENEAILFNKNLNIIEDCYNDFNNSKLKFIGLSQEEWNKLKEDFIKNKDKYSSYINEDIDYDKIESVDLATQLFGKDILEIR